MILNMHGNPIEELDDLGLSDVQLTGLESIARERSKIIETVLPNCDIAERRNAIAYIVAALATGSGNVYADSPNPFFRQLGSLLKTASRDGLSRRAFIATVAAFTTAGKTLKPSQADAASSLSGYDSPRSLWIPSNHPSITPEDYPPLNSTISQDVPGDWNSTISPANRGLGNIDFAAKRDGSTKIVPAAIGDVSEARYAPHNGWYVVMRNGLGFATVYAHLQKISDKIIKNGVVQRGIEFTPEDEIGDAGNTGTGAKGFHHLGFNLLVPPYVKPNNSSSTNFGAGKNTNTLYSADPARFAEYCVAGKNVDGTRVPICNYSINYRQSKEFDRGLWEKDKEFKGFLGDLRRELGMSREEFRGMMKSVLYYYHILLIEEKLKGRFDGKLPASRADAYLEKLDDFKNFRGPILTAPIMNPYRLDLY